jgi:putative tricarboxylic transport membrane protein
MSPKKNIASSLVLILFGTVFLIYTTRYPIDDWESPGPAVFPLILGAVLVLLAVGQLVQALWALGRRNREAAGAPKTASFKSFLHENRGEAKVLYLTVMLVLYILMMKWIGFFTVTFLLVALTSRLMGAKGWARPIGLSLGVCIPCYYLFEAWLKLSFPRGIFF